eukprot:TRINITY_DN10401_c0_g1_i1.p1 TRINITY_DN10401_c0_g1~~TRINITY_DN10401_c0_g1_i1.p1  ORF type:complete len:535 (+),score=9.69 TRINITY_DN10401_c0_g1_i1:78-1607(+)
MEPLDSARGSVRRACRPEECPMFFRMDQLAPARTHGAGQPLPRAPGGPLPASVRVAASTQPPLLPPPPIRSRQPSAPRPLGKPIHPVRWRVERAGRSGMAKEADALLARRESVNYCVPSPPRGKRSAQFSRNPLPPPTSGAVCADVAATAMSDLSAFDSRHEQTVPAPEPDISFSLKVLAWQQRCGGDVRLIDKVPRMVSTLFALQVSDSSGTLRRLARVDMNDLRTMLHAHSSGAAGWLSRRQAKAVLRTILGPPQPEVWEEEMIFDLFDTDMSGSLEIEEFVVGLRLLLSANGSELLMHKVHAILSLAQRRPLTMQFITRFETQLLFDSVASFWDARAGREEGTKCRNYMEQVMQGLSWTHSGRMPAQNLRDAVLNDPRLVHWFMCENDPVPDKQTGSWTRHRPPLSPRSPQQRLVPMSSTSGISAFGDDDNLEDLTCEMSKNPTFYPEIPPCYRRDGRGRYVLRPQNRSVVEAGRRVGKRGSKKQPSGQSPLRLPQLPSAVYRGVV